MRYRKLDKDEHVRKGDQYYDPDSCEWFDSDNWRRCNIAYGKQSDGIEYRRPLKSAVAVRYTSTNKRFTDSKTSPKSAKRRLRKAS